MTQEAGFQPLSASAVAAVCGLPCEACAAYIATHDDPARLSILAARWKVPVGEMQCDGCRAERRSFYCRTCELFACAAKRGHAFCMECDEYPCKALDDFRREAPHRAEIYENLSRIREVGADAWLAETRVRYRCPSCGAVNSAYDLKCYRCGHSPSCDFVVAHKDEIMERLSRL
jgi:predicted RNA-binding Zn-ribbon protein involved in translation (DUF1610 family)